MGFVEWVDSLKRKTPFKVVYFWTEWCEGCEEEKKELEKIEKNWDNLDFIEINADERPDLAIRYSPQIYPSISFISDRAVIGGTYGYVEFAKINELLLITLDLVQGGGKIITPITVPHSAQKVSWRQAVNEIRRKCLAFFDINFGGFEKSPKYYLPNVLRFLLKMGDPYSLEVVKYTLDAAIYYLWDDGFYAYSKSEDWKDHSNVKLIDVNADMILTLIEAYKVTKDEYYLDYAIETGNWILQFGDPFFPIAIVDGRKMGKPLLDVNSKVGEAIYNLYLLLEDKTFLQVAEKLARNLTVKSHVIGENGPIFLQDLSYLLRFLGNMGRGNHVLDYIMENFYGGDAFFDTTKDHAMSQMIGRFKLIDSNSVLAQALLSMGKIDLAQRISEYFLDKFQEFAYFSQADYGSLLASLNGIA
ncbi:thioredoxin [Candidatus Acidianus copahuensis]|uniref:Thioredoxin n=1 Tax=Candidatus Acidianus copahuensis TaxID=1160895 RepID=A0A031LKB0_9CREN|nr:thioredoxin domain-containing protein [Candidatus Acidianus copahuensis]EZQ01986.1 thioredoxin [Candidatus Acidianus copahuensis]